ncbi:MAG: DUF555 domain-containing protein [Archaeoglobaceae archaeon]
MNYKVTLNGAWIVKSARSPEDAMNIAVSEAGKKLDLDFVEVNVGDVECPKCKESLKSVFLVANTAIVGLFFEIKVFNADSEEHASRIARYEIGKRLKNIPLEVVEVKEIGE